MIDLSSLDYNSGYGWYDASTTFRGITIYVYVSGKTGEELPDLNKRVNETIAWLDKNLTDIKSYCADELLEDKNADWVDETHPAATANDFQQKLTLGAIRFRPDKRVLLTFNDDGLFWGHWVMVMLKEDLTPKQAYIEG